MTETRSEDTGSDKTRRPFKWFVLVTYAIFSSSLAMSEIIFAPIPKQTAAYYGVKVNQVDWFYIVQMLAYVPVGLFTLYIVDIIGLKKSLWISSAFNAIGTGLRLVTAFHDGSSHENCQNNTTDVEYSNWYCPSPKWSYPVALVGMIISSIANALRSGLPSKLTAQWFEPNEYDIANSLTSLSDPLGSMITFLIVPFIVKDPSDMSDLQIYFAIPVFLSFIGMLFIRQEGYNDQVNEQSFKTRLSIIFRSENTNNYLILVGFFIYGAAEFLAIMTLIVQFLCPFGYDNIFSSSICISIIIGTGICISIGVSFLVQGTRRHVLASKIISGIAILGLIGFNISMQFPENKILIGASLVILGGAVMAFMPLANELIVETTYPAGEATSTGIAIWFAGPLSGVLVALSSLIPYGEPGDYPDSVCRAGELQDLSVHIYDRKHR